MEEKWPVPVPASRILQILNIIKMGCSGSSKAVNQCKKVVKRQVEKAKKNNAEEESHKSAKEVEMKSSKAGDENRKEVEEM